MLTLWWYFYTQDLDRPGPFLKALNQANATVTYPNGKKALDAVTRGLIQVIRGPEKDMPEKTVANKVDVRLKMLLPLARSKSAETSAEPDADAQVEAAIVETVKEVEASGDAA
jgi:hypothetical protein